MDPSAFGSAPNILTIADMMQRLSTSALRCALTDVYLHSVNTILHILCVLFYAEFVRNLIESDTMIDVCL
jgi:hypothetical protein